MKFSGDEFQAMLPLPATAKWPDGVWDVEAFRHGSMSLLWSAPEHADYQTPHDQDELYVVVSGEGLLTIDGDDVAFAPGDVLFVPAGTVHTFQQPLDDLRLWVILYGPAGGETANQAAPT